MRALGAFTAGLIGAASAAATAQVATDGTLGAATTFTGGAFTIDAAAGRQSGSNLFHSFATFDLAAGRTATFAGPSSILNVIARVTGGQPSRIDGAIRVAMPQADFWFVNPAGVTFGAGATIDVPASFYVSTADYLVLGTDGRFDATDPAASRLTSAAPSAFGFLDATIGDVTVGGARLAVRGGRSIGIVGGDVALDAGRLVAPGGTVQIGAVASAGEARIGADGTLRYDAFGALGDVTLARSQAQIEDLDGNVNVSGTNALASGTVRIRGGTLTSNSGGIVAENFGPSAGGDIDVDVRAAVVLRGATLVSTASNRPSDAGDIRFRAGTFSAADQTLIRTDSVIAGRGGDIAIAAGSIALSGRAGLTSFADRDAEGGDIRLTATGDVTLADSAFVRVEADRSAQAGDIAIAGRNVLMRDNATLQASTFAGSTGRGGAIAIDAVERFELVGTGAGVPQDSALISTRTRGSGAGGDVAIRAASVLIDGIAAITASSESAGDAGDIVVDTGAFVLEGGSALDSQANGAGDGGSIWIAAAEFAMADGARISAEASATGLAGDVVIDVLGDFLLDDARIATAAFVSDGGNIAIGLGGDLLLTGSTIETSVRSGVGNGGNIAIGSPEFFVLRDSRVQANAFGGAGGNIDVTADFIVNSATSVVEASSQLGIDGVITFSTPEVDVAALVAGPVAQRLDDDAVPVFGCADASTDSRLVVGRTSGFVATAACR
jgi:filamentous hemagglutinin family protein